MIDKAIELLEQQLKYGKETELNKSADVRQYVFLKHADKDSESFGVLWLNSKNRLIADETLFKGTLNRCPVYPRDIAARALYHNANACILYHNHPSGVTLPSAEDREITRRISEVLRLLDVTIHDHLICGLEYKDSYSFASKGEVI